MTAEQLRGTESELERRHAELVSLSAALDAERLRYRRLFERAPLAHLTTDLTGKVIDANGAAGRLLRVEPRFLVGKQLAAFVAPSDQRRFRSLLLRPVDTEHPVFRLQCRRHIPLDAEVRVFQDADTLSWVIRDVTDERRAEQQLWELNRELEQRVTEQAGEIATVYDQLPVGVAIVRPSERGAPRLNQRGRQILGDAFPFEPQVELALSGAETRSAILRLEPPGRSEVVLHVSAVPMRDSGGSVTGAVVTFDDVTDRENVERAEREFVTNASHQLRSPITAISSAVAALKAGAGEDPAERGRFLDHLEAEADRLARIIDAMLVLSRAQRRDVGAPLTLVPVRPLLARLVSEARPADGVTLSCTCAESIAVIAHPALLEEAVASVLANAVEHTPAGSVAVQAREQEDRVVIEVVDTGTGMAPEVRDRAFERFFSGRATGRSAGLGLAIAAAAVRASRGTIELSSEPGAGTRLRILLPSAPLLQS